MSFKPVEVRILGSTTSMPSWFSTFDDLVLLGVTEDQPLAFLIRNAAVAESHRQCFASLWNGGSAL